MRHRFHSLCPYFAMFPESFAELWIDKLTSAGDMVVDPFCGRGTAPFQAALMSRVAFGADINPVAYCLTAAKLDPPRRSDVLRRIGILRTQYASGTVAIFPVDEQGFFAAAFHPKTLDALLFLRKALKWRTNRVDRMIAAIILGVLHGESHRSSRYLSNQMPRTIATKPRYSVKYWRERNLIAPERNVFDSVAREIAFRYFSALPETRGEAFLSDFRDVPTVLQDQAGRVALIITSPPYLDTTRFEEDQWLRLWFLGNDPKPTYGKVSRDDRHDSPSAYWRMVGDMWRVFGRLVRPRGHVVVRMGSARMSDDAIVHGLTASAQFSGRRVRMVSHATSAVIRGQRRQVQRSVMKGCRVEVDCVFQVR
jgi:hypothetical protein